MTDRLTKEKADMGYNGSDMLGYPITTKKVPFRIKGRWSLCLLS